MGMIKVRVSDVSGSRVSEVEAPDDVPVNRILIVLIERMNLPLNSPDGQLMSYKLHHRRSGQQLLDNQTLAAASVAAGDELRLQPEITAGSISSKARRTDNHLRLESRVETNSSALPAHHQPFGSAAHASQTYSTR